MFTKGQYYDYYGTKGYAIAHGRLILEDGRLVKNGKISIKMMRYLEVL